MTSVCVIGGGTAGAEAAVESARGGADVTVMDPSALPDVPWKQWPELVSSGGPSQASALQPGLSHQRVRFCGLEAKGVRPAEVFCEGRGWIRFDAVVLASGSRFAPCVLPGRHKAGVYVLDSAAAYESLGRQRSSVSRAVVIGEGVRALEVADRLKGGEGEVHVVISHWSKCEPSPDIMAALLRAAGERGVSLLDGPVTKAVGQGVLEAIVAGDRVEPCDTLALLPRRLPRVVRCDANLGVAGGIRVDGCLRTSLTGVLAAGGCAEVSGEPCGSSSLEDEPGWSGRIAGANALGRSLTLGPMTRSVTILFGLRWTRMSTRPRSGATRFPLGMVSCSWGPSSACAIAYERTSGRVVRVECVEEACAQAAAAPTYSEASSLATLAYGGSSDISMVSDTARLGLRQWSNS